MTPYAAICQGGVEREVVKHWAHRNQVDPQKVVRSSVFQSISGWLFFTAFFACLGVVVSFFFMEQTVINLFEWQTKLWMLFSIFQFALYPPALFFLLGPGRLSRRFMRDLKNLQKVVNYPEDPDDSEPPVITAKSLGRWTEQKLLSTTTSIQQSEKQVDTTADYDQKRMHLEYREAHKSLFDKLYGLGGMLCDLKEKSWYYKNAVRP